MKCRGWNTVVGALYDKRSARLYVAHVGEIAAYRFRGGELTQITKDHFLNDYLSVMPFMTEEQRAELPVM